MQEVLIRTRELPKLSRDIVLGAAEAQATTELTAKQAARAVPIPREPRHPMSAQHDIPIQA